jgi:hypothetical protein
MSALPGLLPPVKVMLPVVGAVKVTVEVDAVAVIGLRVIARVTTIAIRIALRILGNLVTTGVPCW